MNNFTVFTAGLFGNIPAQSNKSCHCKWINIGDICDFCLVCWQLVENRHVASICASERAHSVASIRSYKCLSNVPVLGIRLCTNLVDTSVFMWKSHIRTQGVVTVSSVSSLLMLFFAACFGLKMARPQMKHVQEDTNLNLLRWFLGLSEWCNWDAWFSGMWHCIKSQKMKIIRFLVMLLLF